MVERHSVDVLVVGAGLSGLQTAVKLHEAGLSYLILEADDRIGGKVLSVSRSPGEEDQKGTVDMGPAWINDTSQSQIWALAQKYGIKFETQILGDQLCERPDGSIARFGKDDLPLSQEVLPQFMQLLGTFDELGQKIKQEDFHGPVSQKLDQVTFEEWLKEQTNGNPEIMAFLSAFSSPINGAEIDEYSALYMLKYIESATGFANIIGSAKDGGQYLRPYTGSIGYVDGLVSELNPDSILLSQQVKSIEQDGETCIVSTSADQTFQASKVVVTCPTALYYHIKFTPELPPAKLELSKSTKMGYYTKVVAVYDRPWWRQAGLVGISTSLKGPVDATFDTCIEAENKFTLSLFICGRKGKEWSEQPKDKRIKVALDHVKHLFGGYIDDIPEPVNIIEKDWQKAPFHEGAPTPVYPPGVITSPAGRSLLEPAGHIHFAGTETSPVWEGYMEGALRSGSRAADEVIQILQRS